MATYLGATPRRMTRANLRPQRVEMAESDPSNTAYLGQMSVQENDLGFICAPTSINSNGLITSIGSCLPRRNGLKNVLIHQWPNFAMTAMATYGRTLCWTKGTQPRIQEWCLLTGQSGRTLTCRRFRRQFP